MSNPYDNQVGGDHYKNTRYSLANSSIKTNCYSLKDSIKYIVRHQDKGGKESSRKRSILSI